MTNSATQLPQRGNRFTRAIAAFIFRILGWQVVGSLPDLPKMIMISGPHTSNWDFLLSMNTIFYLGVNINWMAKKEFFVAPFSRLWVWLGGVPIDRSASHGVVGETVAAIQERARIVLAILPEGTRSEVKRWRTGFYHIAHQAGIPIVPMLADYGCKTLTFTEPFTPSGDIDVDLPLIQARFVGVQGKRRS